ncbi:SusD/RagB family nutrient-binding outer membrane lipoprotein [Mucilaginibacter sp.]
MKKLYQIFALGALALTATSCKKYLDVNDNPNQALSTTAPLIMSQALTTTAANLSTSNGYGSGVVGYTVNGGGYGGFGSAFTYSYATTENTGLFNNTFDNTYDYQTMINLASAGLDLEQFGAVGRVMMAYNYGRLIDLYGDVPYTEAFRGSALLTPKYDPAPALYQTMILKIDTAIAAFKAKPIATPAFRTADVMFGVTAGSSGTANTTAEIQTWIKFAQTVKLRLLTHIQGVSALSSFVNTEFANFDITTGFLIDDAIVNPGYIVSSGKQNPDWDTYNLTSAGAQAGSSRVIIPGQFVFDFYNGVKVSDDGRGALEYANYPNAAVGILSSNNNPTVASTAFGKGIFKSATQGRPMFLAAESYFLQAEANLNGKIAGSAATNFDNGIKASYKYLNKDGNNNTTVNTDTYLTAYKAANSSRLDAQGNETNYYAPIVNYNLAKDDAKRLEAIITQKYIALNFIFGGEAWTEFRRTTYPAITNGSPDPNKTFASAFSTSPRPDRLPVRLPYPDTEYQLNSQNVPTVNVFTSRIFWDLN